MRESTEDWLELGRDLTSRGLAAPRLVVADGAPELIGAVAEIWPRADRQHCAVHRLRNLLGEAPEVRAEPDPVQSALLIADSGSGIQTQRWHRFVVEGALSGPLPLSPARCVTSGSRGKARICRAAPNTPPRCSNGE